MKKILIVLLAVFVLGFPTATYAALSSSQIEAVLGLLRAFNAPETSVMEVSHALRGTVPNTPVIPTPPHTPEVPENIDTDPVVLPQQPAPGPTTESPTKTPAPSLSLKANPVSIASEERVVISWSAKNATGCGFIDSPISHSFGSSSGNVMGSITVSPSETETYTMQCKGAGGSITQSVTIAVEKIKMTAPQSVIIDAHNVYSPEIVVDGDNTWLYFGGWKNQGQTHDNIYRAHCNSDFSSCKNIETIITATDYGFSHFNDPDIVRMPGGYYIMYMTGLPTGEGDIAASDNNIYYATSWVGDGFNWSEPTLLAKSYWLPSAVVLPDGNVYLYANDTLVHGGVVRMNMGPSGIGLQETTKVSYGSAAGSANYANVDVTYSKSDGGYTILGERIIPKSVIDTFFSKDGISWKRITAEAVLPAEGQYRVATPGQHPTNPELAVFGSTAQTNSMGFDIRVAPIPTKDSTSGLF